MAFPLPVPVILLAAAVLTAGVVSLVVRGRGGRFRTMPGWSGFWVFFSIILVALSRIQMSISLFLLAALMLASLKAYFSIAPVRPADRYAILAAYVAVPLSLYTTYIGSISMFLMTVLLMALTMPILVSFSRDQAGMLDSLGRMFSGSFFFVFCTAHLGLLANHQIESMQVGLLELFGLMVLAAELPQRLAGRAGEGNTRTGKLIGLLAGILLAMAAGYLVAPYAGLTSGLASGAAVLVALAAAGGAAVSNAVAADLEMKAASSLVGGGALLDRAVPALFAAPVFYHYLNYLQ